MTEKPYEYLSDDEYKFVYSRTPRLCVDLAVVGKDGVLLTLRQIPPFKNTWHFPGGRVLHKETIEDAIKRIAGKELGVEMISSKLLDFLEVPNDGPYVHSVSLVFLVKISGADNIKTDEQASDASFFKKLPKNIHPHQRSVLEKHTKRLGIKFDDDL